MQPSIQPVSSSSPNSISGPPPLPLSRSELINYLIRYRCKHINEQLLGLSSQELLEIAYELKAHPYFLGDQTAPLLNILAKNATEKPYLFPLESISSNNMVKAIDFLVPYFPYHLGLERCFVTELFYHYFSDKVKLDDLNVSQLTHIVDQLQLDNKKFFFNSLYDRLLKIDSNNKQHIQNITPEHAIDLINLFAASERELALQLIPCLQKEQQDFRTLPINVLLCSCIISHDQKDHEQLFDQLILEATARIENNDPCLNNKENIQLLCESLYLFAHHPKHQKNPIFKAAQVFVMQLSLDIKPEYIAKLAIALSKNGNLDAWIGRDMECRLSQCDDWAKEGFTPQLIVEVLTLWSKRIDHESLEPHPSIPCLQKEQYNFRPLLFSILLRSCIMFHHQKDHEQLFDKLIFEVTARIENNDPCLFTGANGKENIQLLCESLYLFAHHPQHQKNPIFKAVQPLVERLLPNITKLEYLAKLAVALSKNGNLDAWIGRDMECRLSQCDDWAKEGFTPQLIVEVLTTWSTRIDHNKDNELHPFINQITNNKMLLYLSDDQMTSIKLYIINTFVKLCRDSKFDSVIQLISKTHDKKILNILLCYSVVLQRSDFIQKLIDKNADINYLSEDNKTIFLHCLIEPQGNILQLILNTPTLDPVRLFPARKTAFGRMLFAANWTTHPKEMAEHFHLLFDGSTIFDPLLQYLPQDDKSFVQRFIDQPALLFNTSNNTIDHIPLLFAFYLQDLPLAQLVASNMTPKDFKNSVSIIKKKFPNSPMHLIEFALFQLNTKHMSQEVGSSIPPKPAGAQVDDLLTMCQDLTIDTETQELLKKDFVEKINEKRAYLGTPAKNTPALTEFYTHIENAVCHVMAKLNSLENSAFTTARKTHVIRAFAKIAHFCGGAIQRAAIDQYDTVVRSKTLTFEKTLYEAIGDHRKLLFDALIPSHDQNIHTYNQLFFLVAKELNLPYADTAFNDTAGPILSPEERELQLKNFYALYTPQSIIAWIELKLKQEADFRDQYIDWWKKNIPTKWKEAHYEPIKLELVSVVSKSGSQEDIANMLRKHNIMIQAGMSPEQAIQDDRTSAYLQECVYDENSKLTSDAMVQMLVTCEVITPI